MKMAQVMSYVAYTAGALYVLLGLAILFTDLFPSYLPGHFKVMMGIVLCLYGMFRLVSVSLNHRKNNEEIEGEK
jgi:hypothetical protein